AREQVVEGAVAVRIQQGEGLSRQLAQGELMQALGGRVYRRQRLLDRCRRGRVHDPVFRVHQLQAVWPPARLAVTAQHDAAGQALLLGLVEMEESQVQRPRAV